FLDEYLKGIPEHLQQSVPALRKASSLRHGLTDVLFDHRYTCPRLHDAVRTCDCEESGTEHVIRRPQRADGAAPIILHGLVASGNQVIEDGIKREELRKGIWDRHQKRLLAVEMEGAMLNGFMMIRGICDYADSHKNKKWQQYSAAT